MTTIMSVKCKDGIVFHSDTLFTDDAYNKVREGTKLFVIPGLQQSNFALGLAGNFYQYNAVKEEFVEKFGDNGLLTAKECKKRLSEIGAQLRKKYDVDALLKSGYPIDSKTREVNVKALFGARLVNNGFLLLHFDAYNDPFEEGQYSSIGEGGDYADFVFTSVIPPLFQRLEVSWTSFSTKLVSQFVFLLMRRIAAMRHAATGGPTTLVICDNQSTRYVSITDIFTYVNGRYEPDIAIQFLNTIKDENLDLLRAIKTLIQ